MQLSHQHTDMFVSNQLFMSHGAGHAEAKLSIYNQNNSVALFFRESVHLGQPVGPNHIEINICGQQTLITWFTKRPNTDPEMNLLIKNFT